MREQKVWIPDNDSMILEAIKAFDITPIPLSIADVRAGLQTGLINTVTTPPIGALALQWHTQIKYLLDEPFLYIYGVLAVDRKVFKRLSPADQQIFREIMGGVFKALDRLNREDNIKAMETLHKQGIKFIKPSKDALKKWREDASEVPNRLVKAGRLSREMVDTLENFLKEYRLKESKN
jgi:TRAP-type C4-dicarboxylate transport system substrate-binding protein